MGIQAPRNRSSAKIGACKKRHGNGFRLSASSLWRRHSRMRKDGEPTMRIPRPTILTGFNVAAPPIPTRLLPLRDSTMSALSVPPRRLQQVELLKKNHRAAQLRRIPTFSGTEAQFRVVCRWAIDRSPRPRRSLPLRTPPSRLCQTTPRTTIPAKQRKNSTIPPARSPLHPHISTPVFPL